MSKEDKAGYEDDPLRSVNIGWSFLPLTTEFLRSIATDYELHARATKFASADLSGGVSKSEELDLKNQLARFEQQASDSASSRVKLTDRSAADAGKARQAATAALLKKMPLTEEAQHQRSRFMRNTSIAAAIILLTMLLFKLRSLRRKKSASPDLIA